ncbi:MAG: TolC family protein [Ilyomonas sp.]
MKENAIPFACSKWAICILLSIVCFNTKAQVNIASTDTLHVTLQNAEKIFLEKNFQLLAQHYNVEAGKALIQQAGLWDNPVLNTDQVIAADRHFLPYNKNIDGVTGGQYYIQIEQLIKTAGKRGKAINLAVTNSKLNELQLQDMMRNLHYQLVSGYYTLQSQLKSLRISKNQLVETERLLKAMHLQLNLGNIAQKDYLRIQAVHISLQQDVTEIRKTINATQTDLRSLLAVDNNVFIQPSLPEEDKNIPETVGTVHELMQLGMQNNSYYLLQQTQNLYEQQNLIYQKALRVPDVSIGPSFDKNSNFAPNYFGLSISLPIPVFNRNQGNIKAAEFTVKQQQAITQNAETELRNNIISAYNNYVLTLQQNNAEQFDFYKNYEAMFNKMLESYQQRQISLLEFLDFFDAFKESQLRLIQQQLNMQLSKEELNYQVGVNVFNR